eukprot:PITA_01574
MPRKLDPLWEFGELDGPNDRINWTCKLCGHHMSGRVYRLKYHLAQIPRFDVGPCTETNPKIIRRAMRSFENLDHIREAKAEMKRQLKESAEQGSGSGSTAASTNPVATSSFFVPRSTPGSQPSITSMLKKTEKEQADKLLAKFLLWSDIPFSVVRNNPFFQLAVDTIATIGPGYKIPSYHDIRGLILQNEKLDCTKRLEAFRESWAQTGCTVMSDSWTDQKGRTLINFLVSCPKGTMFIKSIDASAQIKDARILCDLLDVFILEVGAENVVQVITDNAANYVAADRMLMDRYPTLFWTPCAAHCIDLMLEDIGKISFVKDIVESSKSITKFIYNHTSVLSLMRKFTNNKELVHPAITRFATSFISLQSLLNSMWDVKRMFLSKEWRALTMSGKPEGEAICRLVSYQEDFWVGVQEVCAVIEPLVKVLRLVDGEKPAMGYLYEAMDRAKESIRAYYDDKGDEGVQRQLLWGVIDERWNNTLHRPIYAARIYLNLAFSYACGFVFDAEIMDGFLTCVQRMVRSPAKRTEISKEIETYRMAGGTFGFDMAVTDRTIKMTGCERNWSVFEKIHNKKHNRLESQRFNDMVYVYYNLRLWLRQLERIFDMEAISLDGIDTIAAWKVKAERPLMESVDDWLVQDVVEEEEEELEQQEEVTSPARATPATSRGRGLSPIALTSSSSTSRAQQTPLPTPPAPASTSRGKGKSMAFSRKRGRGNQ